MGLLDKIREWASGGTASIETPTNTKIDLGWVNNEQPPVEWENFLQNRQDVLLNKFAESNNRKAIEPYIGDIQARISGHSFEDNRIHPFSLMNVIDLGYCIVDSCRGHNYELNKDTMLCCTRFDFGPVGIATIFEIYNDDDFVLTSVNLSPTLEEDDNCRSICSDGNYVYLATGNGTDSRLYKFSKNPWSSTPIWTYLIEDKTIEKIIIADDSNIGIVTDDVTEDDPIGLFAKDGSGVPSWGYGNATSSASSVCLKNICSDGERIWFFRLGSVSQGILCNALISDLTDGLGSELEISTSEDYYPGCLTFDGQYIWYVATRNETTPATNDDLLIGCFYLAGEVWRIFVFKIPCATYRNTPSDCRIIFDGRRLWIRAMRETVNDLVEYNTTQEFVLPFHPMQGERQVDATTIDLTNKYFLYPIGSADSGEDEPHGGFVYADDCLWIPQYSYTGSGLITRVPTIERLT